MKKRAFLTLTILISTIFVSCNEKKESDRKEKEIEKNISIDSKINNLIPLKNGGYLFIQKNTFDSEKVDLSIKFADNLEQILFNNLSTESSENLLETKGMININYYANGKLIVPNKEIILISKKDANFNSDLKYFKENIGKDGIVKWEEISKTDSCRIEIKNPCGSFGVTYGPRIRISSDTFLLSDYVNKKNILNPENFFRMDTLYFANYYKNGSHYKFDGFLLNGEKVKALEGNKVYNVFKSLEGKIVAPEKKFCYSLATDDLITFAFKIGVAEISIFGLMDQIEGDVEGFLKNRYVFSTKETGWFNFDVPVSTNKEALLTIINCQKNDKITLVYENEKIAISKISKGNQLVFDKIKNSLNAALVINNSVIHRVKILSNSKNVVDMKEIVEEKEDLNSFANNWNKLN